MVAWVGQGPNSAGDEAAADASASARTIRSPGRQGIKGELHVRLHVPCAQRSQQERSAASGNAVAYGRGEDHPPGHRRIHPPAPCAISSNAQQPEVADTVTATTFAASVVQTARTIKSKEMQSSGGTL